MFSKFLKVFFQKIKKLEIKYGLHRMLTFWKLEKSENWGLEIGDWGNGNFKLRVTDYEWIEVSTQLLACNRADSFSNKKI